MLKEDTLITRIDQLKKMLDVEAEKYYCKDKSVIAERIIKCQVNLNTINYLACKNDFFFWVSTHTHKPFRLKIAEWIAFSPALSRPARNPVNPVYMCVCAQ